MNTILPLDSFVSEEGDSSTTKTGGSINSTVNTQTEDEQAEE